MQIYNRRGAIVEYQAHSFNLNNGSASPQVQFENVSGIDAGYLSLALIHNENNPATHSVKFILAKQGAGKFVGDNRL